MNIRVYNIGLNVRDADLRKMFAVFGVVNSVEVMRDKQNGRSKGNAMVEMPIEKEARQAIESLNQMLLDGKKISVSEYRIHPNW